MDYTYHVGKSNQEDIEDSMKQKEEKEGKGKGETKRIRLQVVKNKGNAVTATCRSTSRPVH